MKPTVLGISVSPQKGGKVGTLVQEVLGDRFYALPDLPMPAIDEEDDAAQVRLEFLLVSEKRFPWKGANRESFQYNAFSKCYAACHPEKLKKQDKGCADLIDGNRSELTTERRLGLKDDFSQE